MKLRLIVITALLTLLFAGFGMKPSLSGDEKALLQKNGIPEELALAVKAEITTLFSSPAFMAMQAPGEDGMEVEVPGVRIKAPAAKADILPSKLAASAAGYKCLVFRCEQNFSIGNKPDMIAVIKGSDMYDIVRLMKTDGANYDITNQMLIKKLKSWEKQCAFRITGAELDWVSAEFIRQPKDMNAFAGEVYKFCPDVVDQGSGSVEALANEMKSTNTLYLWWD